MRTQNKMPLALIGEKADDFIKLGLSSNGFKLIPLPADERLATQVSSHADMLISVIDNTIFCNEDYYKKNISIFKQLKNYGYEINHSTFEISNKYPNDVALNQAVVDKNILGYANGCAKSILKYASENRYNYQSIKQGYAKCSTLILGNKAIISADASIISMADKLNISRLKISNGINEIKLDGYDYGFIGGASAVYKDNVFFFGDLKMHSQGNEISEFCKLNGFFPISLGKEKLCDVGGAIILQPLN